MATQNTVISFEQLVRDFDGLFQHRVFRLETLDWYDAPNEHEPYARFLVGEPADPAWREPWKRIVRDIRTSGRTMSRVHIVTEPVSDYIRFELLRVYPANVEAGEDVRILGWDKAYALGVNVRNWDYWLFDDDRAAVLDYDQTGHVEGVEMTDKRRFIQSYCTLRDVALKGSVPLAKYVAEHNITEGIHAA